MIQIVKKIGWERLAVWFVYVLAQFFVLTSLLLTTTSIIPHVFFILLALSFYFITALKEPGTYEGKHEPNHQDAQLSVTKNENKKQQKPSSFKSHKEIRLSNLRSLVNKSQQDDEHKIQKQGQCPKKELDENKQKRTSIRTSSFKDNSLKVQVQKVELPIQGKKSSIELNKFKLFQVAKSVFGNISTLVGGKEQQHHEEPKLSLEDKIEEVSQKSSSKQSNKKSEEPAPIANTVTESANVSSVIRQNRDNSAIDKEDFVKEQEEKVSNKAQEKLSIQLPNLPVYNHNSVQKKISNIKRYCRICQAYQPLRVKHCHSCDRCIATFDHHCPWMANCIGQKNKFFYFFFLLFQTIQILTIVIDLIVFISASDADNKASVGILLMVTLLFLVVMSCLFLFHFYMIAINLTTWEFMRWEKVQYLAIFDNKALSSPFNKGFSQNIKTLWKMTKEQEQKQWIQDITQDLSKYRIRKPKACRSMAYTVQSDRRPFRSQKAIA